jgi:hypothetical protein
MYSAAYAMAYGVEPPLRKDICDFLAELDHIVPALQKQMAPFSPRIVAVRHFAWILHVAAPWHVASLAALEGHASRFLHDQ